MDLNYSPCCVSCWHVLDRLCTKLPQTSGHLLIGFHLLPFCIFLLLALIYFDQPPLLLLIFCVFLTRGKQDFDG